MTCIFVNKQVTSWSLDWFMWLLLRPCKLFFVFFFFLSMFIDLHLDNLYNAHGLQIKITENKEEGIERRDQKGSILWIAKRLLLLLFSRCVQLFCDPKDRSPLGSSVHGFSHGQNTVVGCHFLLQGICPAQQLNLHLLHWQADSLPLSHQGSWQYYSAIKKEWNNAICNNMLGPREYHCCSPSCCCSITKSCPTLHHCMDCNTPDSSVFLYFPEIAQIHVHWVGDSI